VVLASSRDVHSVEVHAGLEMITAGIGVRDDIIMCSIDVAALASVMVLIMLVRVIRSPRVLDRHARREMLIWAEVMNATQHTEEGVRPRVALLPFFAGPSRSRRIAVEFLADVARSQADIDVAGLLTRGSRRRVEAWIVSELGQPDPGRRMNAAEIVGSLKFMSCLVPVARATHDPDASVRVAACRALASLDPEAAVGVLVGAIERDGRWAADLLRDVLTRTSQESRDGLFARLEHNCGIANVILAFSTVQGEVHRTMLLNALESPSDSLVERSIQILSASHERVAIPKIVQLLRSSSEPIRLACIRALEQLSVEDALVDFVGCIGDSSRPVRFAVAAAIANHEHGEWLLRRFVESSDLAVSEAAYVGLWYLTGRSSLRTDHPPEWPNVPSTHSSAAAISDSIEPATNGQL